jgi:hypothetical protein
LRIEFTMSKNRRLELIERIQEKRKSHVITCVLSDRPNAEGSISPDVVREMYRLLSELKPFGGKPLDLFLFAHRGDTTVPWQMVGMIREMFDLFNVIVPHKAHGAATMIALGADTIIMGERGELSPIEVLVPEGFLSGERGLEDKGASVEDAKALMSLMESFGRVREKQRIDAFLRTMASVNPLLLGSMQRRVEQTKTDCLRLLERRRRRFSKGRNRKIISHLFSDFGSSYRIITRSEAEKSIGLKQVRSEAELEPVFQELLALYEQELLTGEPFDPESALEHSDHDAKVFTNRKLVYMESAKGTRVFLEDLKVQKMRESPQNIRLDPQIILPSLNIGTELKEEDLWSFVEGWLQSHLPALIDEALGRFKRSLFVSGYQRTPMNQRWVDE